MHGRIGAPGSEIDSLGHQFALVVKGWRDGMSENGGMEIVMEDGQGMNRCSFVEGLKGPKSIAWVTNFPSIPPVACCTPRQPTTDQKLG